MKKTNKQKQMSDREWIEYAKGYLWLGRNGVYSIAQDHPDAQPRAELKYSWAALADVLNLKYGDPLIVEHIYNQAPQLCVSARSYGGFSGKKASVRLDQARPFLLQEYSDAERTLRAGKKYARGLSESCAIARFQSPDLAWSISIEEKRVTAHPSPSYILVGLLGDHVKVPEIKPGAQIKVDEPERSVAWDYVGWTIAGAFFGAMVIGPLLWR